jgi:DNA-binding CsgD family transcriptional regulator
MWNDLFLPSIKYKEKIDNICKNVYIKLNIKYFAFYIVFNNGQAFVLSNNPKEMLNMYYVDKLYNQDFSYMASTIDDKDYYLCDGSTKWIGEDFRDRLENKFNIYGSYYTIRRSPECMFIFGTLRDKKSDKYYDFYKKTIHDFDDFCCEFVEQFLPEIKEHNSSHSKSLILTNKTYRDNVIRNRIYDRRLTEKERQCLQLIISGKTAGYIAEILNIKITTVNTHKKNILRKMDANHMAQAVVEALKRGEIGSFNNWCENENAYRLNGFSIKNIALINRLTKD